jgi:hypothetical protein
MLLRGDSTFLAWENLTPVVSSAAGGFRFVMKPLGALRFDHQA